MRIPREDPTAAARAGPLYGVGFGGFVDGIVLHQILQWHHMVSSVDGRDPGTLVGLEANTVADGLFHLATWAAVCAEMLTALVAWRQGRIAPSWSFHFGLVLAGCGAFNLVEGVATTRSSASTTSATTSAHR
jgi:uncharacterized membrane protein